MSFYVRREKPGNVGVRRGWTGPIRSERQAEREAEAWRDAGWSAIVETSSSEIKREVRRWMNEVRVR